MEQIRVVIMGHDSPLPVLLSLLQALSFHPSAAVPAKPVIVPVSSVLLYIYTVSHHELQSHLELNKLT